jgi:hypothetical protein
MPSLSAAALLDAWERSRVQPPLQSALTILSAVSPNTSLESLAWLPIGQRNARLLALREQVFGGRLECVTHCPACGEMLELDLPVEGLRAAPPPATSRQERDDDDASADETFTVEREALTVRFRLANSLDLAAAAEAPDASAARARLVERCVLAVEERGSDGAGSGPQKPALSPAALPPALCEAMADPQAVVELDLSCPCGHAWQAPFDVAAYFTAELSTWAEGILDEVHLLASAYGWREADILALGHGRRRLYLDRVLR